MVKQKIMAIMAVCAVTVSMLAGCGDENIRDLDADNTAGSEETSPAEDEEILGSGSASVTELYEDGSENENSDESETQEEETYAETSAWDDEVDDEETEADISPAEEETEADTSPAEEETEADTSPADEDTAAASSVITYELGDKFPSFSTYALDGSVITDDIFSGKDITVINIWGTYCSPCIGEIPELGDWARSMPDNVQLIGLVCDVNGIDDSYTISSAYDILNSAGADYTQIIYSDDMYDFMVDIYAVPTTVFVNSEGYLIGESYVGADVDGYKSMVDTMLGTIQ